MACLVSSFRRLVKNIKNKLSQLSAATSPHGATISLQECLGLLPAAFIVALISLSYALSYGAMIFGSGGSELLAAGLPLVLLSTCTIPILVSLTSSLPFMIGGSDSNSTGVLALMVSGMVASMHAAGDSAQQIVVTILFAIALSTVLAGICMTALGTMRRGSLVQFVPFPVIGGFLAGSGYLLLTGAFHIATGLPVGFTALQQLLHLHWLVWAPALMVAGVMMGAGKWGWTHPLVFPLALLAAGGVFFGGMRIEGISLQQARQMGWLFETLPLDGIHSPLSLPLGQVQWHILADHFSEFFAMIVVITLTILLNATGVGLATRHDVDFNHELRSAGIANILSGALGGVVGCQSLSRTLLSYQFGSRSRVTAVLAALLSLACAAYFSTIAGYIPKPVLAGLLTGLGGALLLQWTVKTWRQLSLGDYLLILLILVVIASIGFVSGVALGIVVACVLFVVDYGRVSCIKMEFSGRVLTARVERTMEVNAILKQHGERTVGICLQGYLFFGSLSQLIDRMRELLKSPRDFVVIDFQRVQGVDASTMQSFVKLRQMCEQAGVALVMTAIPPNARLSILQNGPIQEFANLDSGLEWIENALLQKLPVRHDAADWRANLGEYFGPAELQRLFARMEMCDLATGAVLFRKDEPGDCMVFIESGQISISLALENGERIRLRSFGSGTIVGEMSLYTGDRRTADVIADDHTRVYKLSIALLRQLELDDPAVMVKLHSYVVKVVANRLKLTNEAYRLSF
ncbi:STAS domain-containing protein [Oxalobacteraceae bacterium CAVE-383]|nr:STAS domain-containing protein [Oxalobacteraceae bacterium CAVE-383]